MFETVVVGALSSESSPRVLSCALEVAKASGATLHIVGALRSPEDPSPRLPTELRYTDAGAGSTEWLLGRLRAEMAGQGVHVATHPVLADPADAIATVACQERADLVVVGAGSHSASGVGAGREGRGPLRRRAHLRHHGSVADDVVDKVACAVLIV